MSMPWIKTWTEALDDHKLARLSDRTWRRFAELCLVAGECDAEGYLANGEELLGLADVAWRLRVDEAGLTEDVRILQGMDLVTQDEDGAWLVTNFAKRQGRSQSDKRKAWRDRKKRQRDHEREEAGTPPTVTGDEENVTRDSRVTGTGTGAGVPAGEKRREEKTRQEDPKGAGADAPTPKGDDEVPVPVSLDGWIQLVEHPPPGKNWPAMLGMMHGILFPGKAVPKFSYIGSSARAVGGPGRLAQLFYLAAANRVTGDICAYAMATAKGKRGDKKDGGSKGSYGSADSEHGSTDDPSEIYTPEQLTALGVSA